MYIQLAVSLVSICLINAQDYTYSLEDINITSNSYNTTISPSDFSNQVTLHYFGHQN